MAVGYIYFMLSSVLAIAYRHLDELRLVQVYCESSENVRFPDCCVQPGEGPQPLKNLVLKPRLTIYVHRFSNSTERQMSENTPKILFASNVIRAG